MVSPRAGFIATSPERENQVGVGRGRRIIGQNPIRVLPMTPPDADLQRSGRFTRVRGVFPSHRKLLVG